MSTKFMNFLAMTWFLSVVICLAIEGSYLGTAENSIINDLALFHWLNIAGLVSIPAPNLFFFRGLLRILVWDYSFYDGGYAILQYFWMATLSPGAVWGIGSTFGPVFANLLRFK